MLVGRKFALLFFAALSVSMAYGVTLPLLPTIVGQLRPDDGGAIARHTGWLTGAYTVGLLALSSVWGALSDRVDRRIVIAAGLAGSAAALWSLDIARTLGQLYSARFAAGALAAAVLPAALAYVVDMSASGHAQRRFAWMASATALGFLLGPVIGNAPGALALRAGLHAPLIDSPFAMIAATCLLSATLALSLPKDRRELARVRGAPAGGEAASRRSLALTTLVLLAITTAEVGLTLVSRDSPEIKPQAIAGFFALCSAVMVAVQLVLYPVMERYFGERRIVPASFVAMALGLAMLAWPVSRWTVAAAFVLGGAAVGVLVPALAVRISSTAGTRQGWAMGRQATAANLGQAIGAAATGTLYAVAPALPFAGAAVALAAGATAAAAHPSSARAPSPRGR